MIETGILFQRVKQATERIKDCDEDVEMIALVTDWQDNGFFQMIKEYREEANFDLLLSLLLVGARYHQQRHENAEAISCLCEARHLLLPGETDLKSWIDWQTAEILAEEGEYDEACRYYHQALAVICMTDSQDLAEYYLTGYLASAALAKDPSMKFELEQAASDLGWEWSRELAARFRAERPQVRGYNNEGFNAVTNTAHHELNRGKEQWSLMLEVAAVPKDNKKFVKQMKRMDRMYASYYQKVDLVKKKSYRLLDWDQFSNAYTKESQDSMLAVGCLSLESCFYQRMTEGVQRQVIGVLSEAIPKKLVFATDPRGVWFYFPTDQSESSLKRYINALLNPLLESLGSKYLLSICLPPYTKETFSETSHLVVSGYYDLAMNFAKDEAYQVSYPQEVSGDYFVWEKVQQLLEHAHQEESFHLKYNYFYQKERKKLHCVEFQGIIDDYESFTNKWTFDEEAFWDTVKIRKELYTIQLGCKYLKETFLAYDEAETPSLFIKLSRQTLLHPMLTPTLLAYLDHYQVEPHQVVISIDEDVLFETNSTIETLVSKWHELGIKIGLDEYGAGAMTGSIRNLRINYLRISSNLLQYLNGSPGSNSTMDSLLHVCSDRDVKICYSGSDSQNPPEINSSLGIEVVSGGYYQTKILFN